MTEQNYFMQFISFSKQSKNTVVHVELNQVSKEGSKTTGMIQQNFVVKHIWTSLICHKSTGNTSTKLQ